MTQKMTLLEKRTVSYLSLIMALRMIGLFMVLPVFSLYTSHLHAATPTLIGIAIGVYGLSQALFQLPFGTLSDRYGRKNLIAGGLILFILGSSIAAVSTHIYGMILGRLLQGTGAIGSTLLALIADATREEQRTKAMAISGMTIGLSFVVAMLMGPFLSQWLTVNYLFLLAAFFGACALFLLYQKVPNSPQSLTKTPSFSSLLRLVTHTELTKLNLGILILHAFFTATFIALPIHLEHVMHFKTHEQWKIYLPTLFFALCLSLSSIGLAERKKLIKPFFQSGIICLLFAQLLFLINHSAFLFSVGLILFFAGFTLLEAFLPSLISRAAPLAQKGSAMGLYSSAQFFGIFIGGFFGGWIYGQLSFQGVYFSCFCLAFIWLILAFFMQPPRYLVTETWHLLSTQKQDWEVLVGKLKTIPGIVDIALIPENAICQLKMERQVLQHVDFLHLKDQLQSKSI